MKKINFMVGLLFLSISAVPAFAQQADMASNSVAANVAANAMEKMGAENQESVNDEGYGADDAEYYGAEGANEEVPDEGAKEGTDVQDNAVEAGGNTQMPAGNADKQY